MSAEAAGAAGLTRLVAVRVSEAERADWAAQAAAAGVGLSDLIRSRMAGAVVPTATGVRRGSRRAASSAAVDPALLAAVARVGNNVNQLARRANTGAVVDEAVLVELVCISEDLRALAERG